MTGTPWSQDDDVAASDALADLPPEVAANVIHAPPPSTDEHGIWRKTQQAHLDKALAECGNLMRLLRAAREGLGE
jgi:hypothetical protein